MNKTEFNLETNLTKLPLPIAIQLAQCLEQNDIYQYLFTDQNEDNDYRIRFYFVDSLIFLSAESMEAIRRKSDIGPYLLNFLGHRGQTVGSLIKMLHAKVSISLSFYRIFINKRDNCLINFLRKNLLLRNKKHISYIFFGCATIRCARLLERIQYLNF